jgi:ABC-type antimicrobial peptide transport system permease subunit
LDASVFPEIRQIKLLYRQNVSSVKLIATIVSGVGLVAVALSCVGIVGLVALTISQRTKEIAIRMALGADSSSVLTAVLHQFRWPVAVGLGVGTALAAAGSSLLRVALYGVSNLDLMSYIAACAVLAALVCISMLVPAARALRLNVATTLRGE